MFPSHDHVLLGQGGNASAAGGIGAASALGQGSQNLAGLGAMIASIFASERQVKENIEFHSMHGPYRTYTYNYKGDDQVYRGVMVDEVKEINPEAVIEVDGQEVVAYAWL